LDAHGYDATSGVTRGWIKKIHFAVSSSFCSFVADGTSATARDGSVTITYTNGTGQLKISQRYRHLRMYNVTGCQDLGGDGDFVSVTATYPITPGQTITSP
jgi:hypothetical protein